MDRRRRLYPIPTLLLITTASLIWRLVDATATVHAQDGFALRDGDRVLFYGDSITEQRLYTTFVEEYVTTRFPRLRVRFISSGWAGDRVSGGAGGTVDERLQRDVITEKPTVVTIMLGMNDGGYSRYKAGLFETYARGYEHLMGSIRQSLPGARITLLQPSPYDDFTRPPHFESGYNHVLARYGWFVRELAADQGAAVADLNTPVAAALGRAASLEPALARKIVPDRIHPAPAGHLLMAAALLKAWNAPRLVTAVTIDAAARRVLWEGNTRVQAMHWDNNLTWTQRDQALPMPIDDADPVLHLALRVSDVIDMLDQQPLRVTGLPAPRYRLKIDGEAVGSFTRAELADGLNLAVLPTPMRRQATQVHDLTVKKNAIHFIRWRGLRGAPQTRLVPSLRTLNAVEQNVAERQRAAGQPRARHYELSPERETGTVQTSAPS